MSEFNGESPSGVVEKSAEGEQDKRVYVGNLSYEVRWTDLKDYMRQAGEVVFADVLKTFNGRSKGCGIVEYATAEEAKNAIETLSNTELLGRQIFIREDRVPRHAASSNTRSNTGFRSEKPKEKGTQLFVGNLPYSVGWKELKDLFREAGSIARADVKTLPDGRSKGNGIVIFESPADAQNAISLFNGYELNGRAIEVREDRFADSHNFTSNTHAPSHPSSQRVPADPFTDGIKGNGEPSDTIFVGNLPWSTTNQDLIDLFEIVGKVERAQIKYESNGRSAGSGVVKFDTQSTAELAIGKFAGYEYGNRPLNLSYALYQGA